MTILHFLSSLLANGHDPDLRFFDTIREISGFLIVMNSSVTNLSFKNLQIIRGDGGGYRIHRTSCPAAVVIRHNYHGRQRMKRLHLENLRSELILFSMKILYKLNCFVSNVKATLRLLNSLFWPLILNTVNGEKLDRQIKQ